MNYQEKDEVIKEYGLDDEEFKERMRDMCNLGEALELEARQEARQEESKRKNVEYVRKIMTKLKMSFKEAIVFLEITEDEEKEIEKYFKS